MPRTTNALSDRQEAFVDEYLIDLCGAKAAVRAGYAKRTAGRTASRLLNDPKISDRIAERKRERSEATQIDSERVLREIADLGFSNVQDFLDPEGRLQPLQDLPRGVAASVKKIKVRIETTEDGEKAPAEVVEIEMWDKLSALGKLADHVGLRDANADAAGSLAAALLEHARALPVAQDIRPGDTARSVNVIDDTSDDD